MKISQNSGNYWGAKSRNSVGRGENFDKSLLVKWDIMGFKINKFRKKNIFFTK